MIPVLTHLGGPTLLIEVGSIRLLTDPTFDPAGCEYTDGPVHLLKTGGPAVEADALPPIDAVLLSHDQHKDNLDEAGRAYLPRAGVVLTTAAGADRLGANAVGLRPWDQYAVRSTDGSEMVTVTATPARHGPPGSEAMQGDVVGFVIEWPGANGALYLSGDSVWFEGVAEVGRRFRVTTAVLFLGAAVIPAKGREPLTMTAEEAVVVVKAITPRHVVPVHYDGWGHLTEGRAEVTRAFAAVGLDEKLTWLTLGNRTVLSGASEESGSERVAFKSAVKAVQ